MYLLELPAQFFTSSNSMIAWLILDTSAQFVIIFGCPVCQGIQINLGPMTHNHDEWLVAII